MRGTGIQATNQYQYGVDVTTLTHSQGEVRLTIQLDVSATLIDQHRGVRSVCGNAGIQIHIGKRRSLYRSTVDSQIFRPTNESILIFSYHSLIK